MHTATEYTATLLLVLAASASAGEPPLEEVSTSDPIPLAGGRMVLCRKTPADSPDAVLLHFHGDPATLTKAFTCSRFSGVLVVVNFPGLSSAYSKPLAEDPQLFDQILRRACCTSGCNLSSNRCRLCDSECVPSCCKSVDACFRFAERRVR
jgi:hypothetical protein